LFLVIEIICIYLEFSHFLSITVAEPKAKGRFLEFYDFFKELTKENGGG
jgi:hypothetical protein